MTCGTDMLGSMTADPARMLEALREIQTIITGNVTLDARETDHVRHFVQLGLAGTEPRTSRWQPLSDTEKRQAAADDVVERDERDA